MLIVLEFLPVVASVFAVDKLPLFNSCEVLEFKFTEYPRF